MNDLIYKGFIIKRNANYFGRTTLCVEWTLIRQSDKRNMGTYRTRKQAKEWADIHAAHDHS